MKCLRCGYCCLSSIVVIVIDPKLGPIKSNLRAINLTKEKCPHLQGREPGQYDCAVHDEPWYEETPCYAHGQVEQGNQPCRIGEHLLRSKER